MSDQQLADAYAWMVRTFGPVHSACGAKDCIGHHVCPDCARIKALLDDPNPPIFTDRWADGR